MEQSISNSTNIEHINTLSLLILWNKLPLRTFFIRGRLITSPIYRESCFRTETSDFIPLATAPIWGGFTALALLFTRSYRN